MLKELEQQIKDIHTGSTEDLSIEYGHAIGHLAQVGLCAAEGEQPEEVQIARMKASAEKMIIVHGCKILDFLRPELRALIQPDNLDQLEEDHQQYLALKQEHNKNFIDT